jgi:hypothetical protein
VSCLLDRPLLGRPRKTAVSHPSRCTPSGRSFRMRSYISISSLTLRGPEGRLEGADKGSRVVRQPIAEMVTVAPQEQGGRAQLVTGQPLDARHAARSSRVQCELPGQICWRGSRCSVPCFAIGSDRTLDIANTTNSVDECWSDEIVPTLVDPDPARCRRRCEPGATSSSLGNCSGSLVGLDDSSTKVNHSGHEYVARSHKTVVADQRVSL